MAPIELRAGGAFIALAVVLVLFSFVAFLKGEHTFAITLQFVLTACAAIIFGAFATTDKTQAGSKSQVIALASAVVLLVVGVVVPATTLTYVPTYWVGLWGIGALLCALTLRRLSM